MALGQPKTKMASVSCKTRNPHEKLLHVDITHESLNEYDWQPLSQPFFSLQVLWRHNSMCFQRNKTAFCIPNNIFDTCFDSPSQLPLCCCSCASHQLKQKCPRYWESELFCVTNALPLIFGKSLWDQKGMQHQASVARDLRSGLEIKSSRQLDTSLA